MKLAEAAFHGTAKFMPLQNIKYGYYGVSE